MILLRTAEQQCFAVLAYCFMPDHLHLLVEGTSDSADLRIFIKLAKQLSGRAHVNVHGELLWQEGYHDRVLRASDEARDVARYILHNPVRAGLVARPRDYPFLGSGRWSIDELLQSTGW
jgi:putative transposase